MLQQCSVFFYYDFDNILNLQGIFTPSISFTHHQSEHHPSSTWVLKPRTLHSTTKSIPHSHSPNSKTSTKIILELKKKTKITLHNKIHPTLTLTYFRNIIHLPFWLKPKNLHPTTLFNTYIHWSNSKHSLVRTKFSTATGETKVISSYTQVMLLRNK